MYNSSAEPVSTDYIPSIQDILHILWHQRKMMIAIVLVCVALGSVLVMLLPNAYRASTTLALNDRNLNLNDFQDITAGMKFDDTTVQTEIRMLNSLNLAMRTIKETGLEKIPEFASSGDKRETLSRFLRNLSVDPQGTSRVIEVSFKSRDPELAARVANVHVEAYFESQIESKKQQVAQLSRWFEVRVKEMKADVIKKSQAAEDYRAKENLVIGKDDKELIYQQISDVAGQLVPVEVHRYDVKSKLGAIHATEKSDKPDAIDDVVKSTLIQNLKTQASTIAQQVESLRSKYGPKHPKLLEAQRQLDEVNRAINREVGTIKTSLKNDAAASEAQVAMLQGRLKSLNRQANSLRSKLITFKSLQVEREASEKLLDNFMKNYENIQSQVGFARPNAIIVSSAVAPAYPAPPGKKMLLAVVFVFSVSLALAVVFIMEAMKGGLRNFEDVRRLAQKPLGIIPKVLDPIQAMLSSENPVYREAIKRIYMSGMMNNPARTLLVTSALPKEGRTTFVISMAYYLMSLGHKVVVIDADFLRPSLSRLTRSPDGPGFADVLTNRVSLTEALDIDENGLAILRAGSHALTSPDMLQSARLQELLGKLKQRYAYILIDSGPLLAHSEAKAIAEQADGIIVLIEWIKTSQQSVANMFATLQSISTPILGVVINKVDIGKYKAISSGSDFLLPKQIAAA